MGFIRVASDRLGFEDVTSGQPFVPVGSNHCGVMAALSEGGYCGSGFPLFGHDEYTEVAPAKTVVDLPMKELYTSDRRHESWLQETMRDYHRRGPYDFTPVFERKPLTAICTDLTSHTAHRTGPIETPMGVRE